MFKRALNYLKRKFGKEVCTPICNDEPSVPSIDLDEAARSFVEDVMAGRESGEFVEDLDQEHFDILDKEADPLENANEIPPDSVVKGKANISETGAMGEKPSSTCGSEEVNRPDRVKKCFEKQVDDQTFEMGDVAYSVPSVRKNRMIPRRK
jgi:hypothetical protein